VGKKLKKLPLSYLNLSYYIESGVTVSNHSTVS
jgi:hypothetical protein